MSFKEDRFTFSLSQNVVIRLVTVEAAYTDTAAYSQHELQLWLKLYFSLSEVLQ